MRAPASGSKAKRLAYPDVVAIYKGRVLVMEVKTVKKPRNLYIEPHQVNKLLEFTERAGGEPYIALKVVGTGEWVFIPVSKLEKTESGKYRLRKETIVEGLKLESLVTIIKGVKKLTEFMERKDSSSSRLS